MARLRRLLRVGRALVSDPRLPRPLRWMVAVSLAIKAVPVPDFGVDEIMLAIVALFLATRYRAVFLELWAEAAAV